MNKYHYTYKLIDIKTGEFYFGSRTCECDPVDDSYLGSMIVWTSDKTNLVKEIIDSTFDSKYKAMESEIELIKDNINHPLNRNYSIPGISFHNEGRIFGQKTRKRMSESRLGDKNTMFSNNHSKSTKNKIRKKAFNRVHIEEIRQNMSNASTVKVAVLQLDKELNLISEYSSVKKASELTGLDRSDISNIINGKRQKTAGGFIWRKK